MLAEHCPASHRGDHRVEADNKSANTGRQTKVNRNEDTTEVCRMNSETHHDGPSRFMCSRPRRIRQMRNGREDE